MKLAAERQMVDAVHRANGEGRGDFILLDTRDRAAYEKGHLPGALSFPEEEFDALAAKLSKDREYVTYCWHAT